MAQCQTALLGTIRQDLLLEENLLGFEELRRFLCSHPVVAREAADSLSDLRLLDMLVWKPPAVSRETI